MNYLLSQIWLCLGLTALVAGLAGWFLRGGSKSKLKELEEEWRVKLARAQNERDYYAGEVKSLSAMAEDRESVEQNYQSEKQALSIQLEDMRMDAEMTTEAFKDQERLLKQQALELEESNRSLLVKGDERQQFEQNLVDYKHSTEKATGMLQTAEDKISDLQTELDSTKIQLLDTTDKLSITEGLLAESQNTATQEGQTILLVKDKDDNKTSTLSPSPSPIQSAESRSQARSVVGTGSLLSTPTSSVEIVDAHDMTAPTPIHVDAPTRDTKKTTEQALDKAFATAKNEETDENTPDAADTAGALTDTIVLEKSSDVANDTDVGSDISRDVKQSKADTDIDHKSATLAGAGAAALGMAGKMKDKLTQAKDDLLDKVDPASDVYTMRDIHIINSEDSKRLDQMNIASTEDMIDKCASKEDVERVAKNMGKESWVIRSWVSMADLMRVQGIDTLNAELLELSGISSMQALASSKPQKLTDSIKVIHKHVGKTNHVPDHEEIEAWIKRAKGLPKRLDDNLDKL